MVCWPAPPAAGAAAAEGGCWWDEGFAAACAGVHWLRWGRSGAAGWCASTFGKGTDRWCDHAVLCLLCEHPLRSCPPPERHASGGPHATNCRASIPLGCSGPPGVDGTVPAVWLAGGHEAACPNGPGADGLVPRRDRNLARHPAEEARQPSQQAPLPLPVDGDGC